MNKIKLDWIAGLSLVCLVATLGLSLANYGAGLILGWPVSILGLGLAAVALKRQWRSWLAICWLLALVPMIGLVAGSMI